MAYGIGPISGCHVNPAVSFGVYVAGRMSVADMISYWIAQVLGAIVAAAVLYLILSGKAQGWTGGLGQNGWGAGYLGEYNVVSAFVFEVVATFLFLVCILGVTHPFAPTGFAGLAIGLTLSRHPSGRHQHHRHLGQSGSLDRPGAGRHRLESGRGRAALAVHHRPADRRRRCGLAVPRRSLLDAMPSERSGRRGLSAWGGTARRLRVPPHSTRPDAFSGRVRRCARKADEHAACHAASAFPSGGFASPEGGAFTTPVV